MITRGSGLPGAPLPVDPDRTARRVAGALLVIVTLVVAVIVWWPSAPEATAQRGMADWLNRAHWYGLPRWISFGFIESASNVVMFIPLGLLAALALRRHQWLVVPVAAVGSGIIELVQLIFLPNRMATWGDIAANTTGALIGFLIAVPTLRRRRARRRAAVAGRRLAGDRPARSAGATRPSEPASTTMTSVGVPAE